MARTPSRATGPANRTPRPLPRRRTPGDFAKAFLAFVALLVLLAGVPGVLVWFVGWPLPHRMPALDMVQQQISVTVFVKILTLVVWLAWAQFTACVLVEVKAAVSGVGLPSRVPGAGPSQLLARQLIAAVLLITATAAGFAPSFGQQAEVTHKPAVAAAQQLPGQQQAATVAEAMQRQAAAQAHAAVEAQGQDGAEAGATKFYRIHPPEGRHHDSLWEVAERHLGDGRRYHEIYQLNKDRVQPDGSKLSEASLIRPGWIMEMPADAHGGDLVEAPTQAPAQTPAQTPKVSSELQQQIAEYSKSGDHARPAQQGGGPRAETPAAPSSVPERKAPAPAGEQTPEAAAPASSESGFGLSDALIGAPLLAAGVLGALGRRRRMALWQSAMTAVAGRRGMEPPVPTGADADVHDALLVGADPAAVRFLDRALRGLSASLEDANRSLPVVYAAWFTATELHLQLAQPSGEPPAPWRQGQDGALWSLDRTAVSDDHPAAALDAVAAPYPGLVSLGTLDGARLLLNLEAAPGPVSLSGHGGARAAVLSSVAAELATNGWSDRMTVTVVGFGRELGALAPTRLRHLDSVAVLLEDLGAEVQQRRAALGAAGHDSVLTGRTGPAQHTRWAPHLVLIADTPNEAEAAALAELTAGASRLGIGCLVGVEGSGQLLGASWELEVTEEGRLAAPLLGLEVTAQLLPAAVHDAVVRLFAAADATSGPDGDDPAPAPHAFLVDITEQGRPAVYARLVGTYEIIGLEAPDDERSALLHEALALLLLHREGVHPLVLASAMWPRGVTDEVRDALLDRLREWLGTDEDGSPRLRTDAGGRLTLARSVVSDLDVLRSLHYEATEGSGARRASVRERLLTDALGLVRGPLLADRDERRYGWLGHEIIDTQLPLLVADVALALCSHHMERGRAEEAIAALRTALASSPSDERLWNEILRTTHATGDTDRLLALVAELAARSGPRGLPPRTEALLDELLPSWRGGTAPATAG
ncbi:MULTISPECIES: BTAD domain-containing putative transcriptional regulator [unclassified Streptomyces]|uniref:BTAD domain-containing putative transcriptional regulator n=1 Tax=unclassified Streptomyces TaxID=2593676 RepID=UPI0038119EE8